MARHEAFERFKALRAIRDRLGRTIRSAESVAQTALKRYLALCEAERRALIALHRLNQVPQMTRAAPRRPRPPAPCKRRPRLVSFLEPPELPLEVAMLRLQGWLREQLTACAPSRVVQLQPTLYQAWGRSESSDVRQQARLRALEEHQDRKTCFCCGKGTAPCTVDVGSSSFRRAWRDADEAAHAALLREGIALPQAVCRVLQLPCTRNRLYGWRWRRQEPRGVKRN